MTSLGYMRFCLKSVWGEEDMYFDGSVVTCFSGMGGTTVSIESTHMHAGSYTQNLAGAGLPHGLVLKILNF